jgi:hypothetical protein
MTPEYHLDTLRRLRVVINTRNDRRPKWFSATKGLCRNYAALVAHDRGNDNIDPWLMTDLYDQYYRTWPKWSGSDTYPVPAPPSMRVGLSPGSYNALDAYHNYDGKNKYNKGAQYGRDRRELLDHLIEQMEATERRG